MKLFGTLSELVAIVFRKDTRAITLRPNQAVTYTATTDIQMAPTTDTTQTLVEIDATQTLTNKTFTSPSFTSPSSTDGSFTSVDTFSLDDTDSAFNTAIQSTSTNTANRTLTLDMDDGNRTFELSGDLRVVGGFSTTLTETGTTNVTLPTTGTLATLAGTETLTNKTLTSPTLTAPSSTDGSFTSVDTFSLDDTDSAFNTVIQSTSTNTADRTLTLDVDNGSRTLELSGDFRNVGGNSTTLTTTGATNVTLPTTGTLATLAGSETLANKTLASPLVTGNMLLQNAAGSQPTLQFSEDPDNGTETVTLRAPAALTTSYTLTLPTDDGTSSQFLQTDGSGALTWATPAGAQDSALDIKNLELTTSVAGNALTIALKTGSGADPSGGDPVTIAFRNATENLGNYTIRTATAATSIVVPSGTTLGHLSGIGYPIYVYAIDNAGTIELAVSTTIQLIEQARTTAAISGGTDMSTIYSTTARSGVPTQLIGKLSSTQTTAGTWAVVPVVAAVTNTLNVPAAVVQGRTNGNNPNAGFIGETVEPAASTTNITMANANSITQVLQPGKWSIYASAKTDSGAGYDYIALSISTTSTTHDATTKMLNSPRSGVGVTSVSTVRIVNISTATTYYVVTNSGTANLTGADTVVRFIATRIA